MKRKKETFILKPFPRLSHDLPRWPRSGETEWRAELDVRAGLNDSWGGAGHD